MPIYEFVCEACGRLEEQLMRLTDPPPDPCPECGGKMAKIMSRNSFQLKGGGWYRDLYSSAAPAKNGAGPAPAAPVDKGATPAPSSSSGTGTAAPSAPASATPAAGTSGGSTKT